MIELVIGIGVLAVATYAAARSRAKVDAQLTKALETVPEDDGQLGVGDVLLYLDAELWLAGCISLREKGLSSGPILRLFATPEAHRSEFLMDLPGPPRRWVLLLATSAIDPGAVPDRLTIDGIRMRLQRRGTARVHARGEHVPRTGDHAEYTVHRGPGGQYALVLDFATGDRLALFGTELRPEMVDRLPGSAAA